MKQYFVYILTNKRNGALYSGITNDLKRRVYEHKNDLVGGFTKKYSIHALVYFESFFDPESAILREKKITRWRRQWKMALIEKENPQWRDLYDDI